MPVNETRTATRLLKADAKSIAEGGRLLRDGKLLYMMERRDIESRSAESIADQLTLAFDKHCAPVAK